MDDVRISVVIPGYNVGNDLIKCIDSVIAQTYTNLEIILVDDGSTDNTASICDEYAKKDSRIVAYHKPNGGISDARNYGISKVNSEYFTFIDSDDYVDKDYIEYLYMLLKKYNTLMSIAQHRIVFRNGDVEDFGATGDECMNAHDVIERMLYHDIIDTSCWGKLYKTSIFENIQFPKGRLFEDTAITYKTFIASEKIAVGYESKYNYIMHDISITHNYFSPSKLDFLEMTDNMGQDVIAHYPDLSSAVMRRRVYSRFSTLNLMLDVTDYQKERQQIIDFILDHKKEVLKNPKTPKRDIIALRLLSISFNLYRFVCKKYKKER